MWWNNPRGNTNAASYPRTAGKFLEEFVGEASWIHLDIAGPAFQDKPKAWIDAGGSGAMVRTLVELAGQLAAEAP